MRCGEQTKMRVEGNLDSTTAVQPSQIGIALETDIFISPQMLHFIARVVYIFL